MDEFLALCKHFKRLSDHYPDSWEPPIESGDEMEVRMPDSSQSLSTDSMNTSWDKPVAIISMSCCFGALTNKVSSCAAVCIWHAMPWILCLMVITSSRNVLVHSKKLH